VTALKTKRSVELDVTCFIKPSASILDPHPAEVHITLGVYLKSQARMSNGWMAVYGRTQTTRRRVMKALAEVPGCGPMNGLGHVGLWLDGTPNHIRFVRLAPRTLDTDNLATAFKPIRDQVCCWLAGENTTTARANDGKRSGYTFDYGQQQQDAYGIRIEMRVTQ